jgi:hypothetical protein
MSSWVPSSTRVVGFAPPIGRFVQRRRRRLLHPRIAGGRHAVWRPVRPVVYPGYILVPRRHDRIVGGGGRDGGAGMDIGDFEVKNRHSTETMRVAVYNQTAKGSTEYERVNQNEMQRGFFGREKVTELPPNSKAARIFYARARDFGITTYLVWRSDKQPWPAKMTGAQMTAWPRKQQITFPTLRTIDLK